MAQGDGRILKDKHRDTDMNTSTIEQCSIRNASIQ